MLSRKPSELSVADILMRWKVRCCREMGCRSKSALSPSREARGAPAGAYLGSRETAELRCYRVTVEELGWQAPARLEAQRIH